MFLLGVTALAPLALSASETAKYSDHPLRILEIVVDCQLIEGNHSLLVPLEVGQTQSFDLLKVAGISGIESCVEMEQFAAIANQQFAVRLETSESLLSVARPSEATMNCARSYVDDGSVFLAFYDPASPSLLFPALHLWLLAPQIAFLVDYGDLYSMLLPPSPDAETPLEDLVIRPHPLRYEVYRGDELLAAPAWNVDADLNGHEGKSLRVRGVKHFPEHRVEAAAVLVDYPASPISVRLGGREYIFDTHGAITAEELGVFPSCIGWIQIDYLCLGKLAVSIWLSGDSCKVIGEAPYLEDIRCPAKLWVSSESSAEPVEVSIDSSEFI
jgi:hypothetical protein